MLFSCILLKYYNLSCQLISWSIIPLWKASSCSASDKILGLLWNLRFINVITRAYHWTLSWTSSIQSTPSDPITWRSIIILPSHLCLGFPRNWQPSSFNCYRYQVPCNSAVLSLFIITLSRIIFVPVYYT